MVGQAKGIQELVNCLANVSSNSLEMEEEIDSNRW